MRLLLPNHPALLQGRQVLLILQLWLRLLPPVPLLMPLPHLELLVPPQEIPVLRLVQVVLRLLLPAVSLLRKGLLVLLLEVLIRLLDQVLLLLLLPMAIWMPILMPSLLPVLQVLQEEWPVLLVDQLGLQSLSPGWYSLPL